MKKAFPWLLGLGFLYLLQRERASLKGLGSYASDRIAQIDAEVQGLEAEKEQLLSRQSVPNAAPVAGVPVLPVLPGTPVPVGIPQAGSNNWRWIRGGKGRWRWVDEQLQ